MKVGLIGLGRMDGVATANRVKLSGDFPLDQFAGCGTDAASKAEIETILNCRSEDLVSLDFMVPLTPRF
jgi:hypothetical protein